MIKLLTAAGLAMLSPAAAHATEVGIDVGWVVSDGAVVESFDPVQSLGIDWVRINFRLDAWNAPDDATPHGPDGLTWYAAYDRVVDGYLARGFQVYGLLNDEAVVGDSTAAFVGNAVQIIDHFKDRIRTWEVINEPNDWANGSSARVPPERFAQILQDTYLAVKHDAGHAADRCWQVELVSGPLFAFDGASASDYLATTYAYGTQHLAWDYTHEATGSYPLDGVGYHLYVAQGNDSALGDVAPAMHDNLAALWSVIAQYEGNDTGKQIYLSEYGFRADAVGDTGQADRLAAGFDALADFGHVALGVYFNLNDFPGNAWGVFDGSGGRRSSADRLRDTAGAHRPARWAVVTHVAAPTVSPGGDGDVVVTIENRGATAWADPVRLGAATGCPDATATNELAWTPDAGYANGVTDARVLLPAAVPPGGSVDIHVPIHAPDAPGTYRFAARMVDEGVAWFGMTATADVTVAGDAPGGDALPDHRGGGCAAGGGAGLGAIGALLALRRRKR